jgi:hypothetical protein
VKFEITSGASDDYGDYATIRVWFDDESWLELDVADAHNLGDGHSQGGCLTVHHADGEEAVAWDGTVMPAWFAKRKAEG